MASGAGSCLLCRVSYTFGVVVRNGGHRKFRSFRLARNVAFVSALMESGTTFTACDNPHATPFMLHLLVVFAEHEREMIRERTRAAGAYETFPVVVG
jgi:Resolvase, N terminal domain